MAREWTAEEIEAGMAKLRAPFPSEVIGQKPQPYRKDSPKRDCSECGGYHGVPAMHLDYVGHAAVTDRLNSVDPGWSLRLVPGPDGHPARLLQGWLGELTVMGITHVEVGEGTNAKALMSDLLKRCAMRFGVAVDMWSKEDLLDTHEEAPQAPAQPRSQSGGPAARPPAQRPAQTPEDPERARMLALIAPRLNALGSSERAALREWRKSAGIETGDPSKWDLSVLEEVYSWIRGASEQNVEG